MNVRWLGALLALGCGVPQPNLETHGVSTDGGGAGPSGGGAACGRGFMVIGAGVDYASGNVALLDREAVVLTESFASSATSGVGLGPMLSGDIVAPTMPQTGSELVLVDRRPASRLVWLDLATSDETGRLDVGDGFVTNPHDYARVARDKAYVTRFDESTDPSGERGRAGGDVLVVDPLLKEAVGRIDLRPAIVGEPVEMQPRPERMVVVDGRVFVLLAPSTASFLSSADARVVEIDPGTDAIVDTLVLEALAGCTGMSLSPDGEQVAVGCIAFDGRGDVDATRSGIALLDVRGELVERDRFPSDAFAGRPAGFYVEFATSELLIATSFGEQGAAAEPDRLLALDLRSRTTEVLLSREEPFTLGEVRCACGSCVAADASVPGGAIVPVRVVDGVPEVLPPVVVERRYALSPRYVGRF